MTEQVFCKIYPALQSSLIQLPISQTIVPIRFISVGDVRFIPDNEIDPTNLDPIELIQCRVYPFSRDLQAQRRRPVHRAIVLTVFTSFGYIRFVPWIEFGPTDELSSVNFIVIDDGVLSLPRPSDLGPESAVHFWGCEIDEMRSALQLEKSKYEVVSREVVKLCQDLLDTQERWGRGS